MSEKDSNRVQLLLNKGGKDVRISCPRGIADLLTDSTTDPAVKQSLLTSLLERHSDNQTAVTGTPATASCTPATASCTPATASCTPVTASGTTATASGTPFSMALHFWTDKEEDFLVSLRHDRNDDFISTRNHFNLWKTIVAELETIKCKVSPQQAFNKYSALKKKWKEIIDAPSGSEVKYFRHKTSFDNQYGNKAGTKPLVTIDTDKDDQDHVLQNDEISHEGQPKKTKGKALKRKSMEMLSIMKEQHEEMKTEIRQQHKEKMTKLDRMLDLYQREVETKCAKNE